MEDGSRYGTFEQGVWGNTSTDAAPRADVSGFNLLHTASELFVIITPFGAYKMNSAPMGWLNTPALFQDRIATEILLEADLYLKYEIVAAVWIDDMFRKVF